MLESRELHGLNTCTQCYILNNKKIISFKNSCIAGVKYNMLTHTIVKYNIFRNEL